MPQQSRNYEYLTAQGRYQPRSSIFSDVKAMAAQGQIDALVVFP